MKKIIISILIMFMLIITGCYNDDTATVKISFNNLPVAHNVQHKSILDRIRSFFIKDAYAAGSPVYIAALKESDPLVVIITDTDEIAGSNNTVEIEIPAGDRITILALYDSLQASYLYGNATVNLKAGEVSDVTVKVINTLQAQLDFWYEDIVNYNPITGVSKYILEGFAGNGPWEVIYEGMELPFNRPSGYDSFRVYLNFNYFNITCGYY